MGRLWLLMAVIALSALAADITGTWKGTASGANGTFERTFVFKVDGSKLTGETTSAMMGKSTIMEGKVDGDSISFSITGKIQDNDVKLNYKGKVSGSEIHLTSSFASGDGTSLEWVATKVQ
jgi:hypothetical protein